MRDPGIYLMLPTAYKGRSAVEVFAQGGTMRADQTIWEF